MFYENKGFLPRIYRASKAYLLAGDESSFQALSLSGHLDAPFLVMLKDLEGEGDLEKALDRVSGVIFFDSNLADGICSLFEKGYGAELRDGKYMFEVKKTGSYDVFVKSDSESDTLYLNGNPITTGVHENRGLRWKKAGTVGLGKGAHTVSVQDRGGAAVVEVIPHEFFSRVKGLLEGKIKEDGFEVVYILGAGIKAGKVTLPWGLCRQLHATGPIRKADNEPS